MQEQRNEVPMQFFPDRLRKAWKEWEELAQNMQEIRLRVNQRTIVIVSGREIVTPIIYAEKEMDDIFRHLCHDSIYAYEEERRQGFLVVSGGHRIGMTGELTAVEQSEWIVKYIRYMNIRIAHEIAGVAEAFMPYLYQEGRPLNTLVISPPGVGKTTLLRDMIRCLSNGWQNAQQECYRGVGVGVIDERGEIAGAYRGSASLDCGTRTDIITGGTKRKGVEILIRTFSPRLIAMDEIGTAEDADAILRAGVSGCRVLASAHGNGVTDVEQKPELASLLDRHLFQRFVVLEQEEARRFGRILDGEGKELCGRKQLQEA